MNRQNHLQAWDVQRMRHGITLRLLEQIPADKLTSHPIAGMRTPVEIAVHMYSTLEHFAAAVRTGSLGAYDEKSAAAAITTHAQLLAFVNQAWEAGDREAQAVTDAQLASSVAVPWGKTYPGFAMLGFIADEFQHHRGQLYAYVRTFGIEPVFVWDFEHNAPQFQPRQHAAS